MEVDFKTELRRRLEEVKENDEIDIVININKHDEVTSGREE